MVSENWPNPLIKSSIPTIPLAIWMASAMISPSARKNLRPSGDLPRWPRYAWLHCSRWPASSSPPCSLATDRCAWTSKGSRKMQLCMSLINIERERDLFIHLFHLFIFILCLFIHSLTYLFTHTYVYISIYTYVHEVYSIYRYGLCVWLDMDYFYMIWIYIVCYGMCVYTHMCIYLSAGFAGFRWGEFPQKTLETMALIEAVA